MMQTTQTHNLLAIERSPLFRLGIFAQVLMPLLLLRYTDIVQRACKYRLSPEHVPLGHGVALFLAVSYFFYPFIIEQVILKKAEKLEARGTNARSVVMMMGSGCSFSAFFIVLAAFAMAIATKTELISSAVISMAVSSFWAFRYRDRLRSGTA
jgi:hypothetical protein